MSGNGHGLTLRYQPHEEEMHQCSFCDRIFSSLQSLGGHLTSHRGEIAMMRREHEAFMEGRQRARSRGEQDGFPFKLLTPNYAFWEAYRRGHPPPPTIKFMEIPELQVVEQPTQVVNHA